MKLFIAFGVCAAFLFSQLTEAQKKPAALHAVVVSEGAAVYERPDFDSRVLDFVPYKTAIPISRKAYAGADGLGLFHKTRVRGKIGYVPDTDIRVVDKEKEKTPTEPAKTVKVTPDGKPKSLAWEKEEEEVLGRAPLYLTRYLGAAAARVRFTERFSGHKLSDEMMMYGLRMTGPGTLFDGPPLDVNFWFSLDKPAYYSVFSEGVHGFLMFGDILALFPLLNHDNWVINYGLGPMWTFTRYRVRINGANTDSLEFRIGGALDLGGGYRIGKSCILRADVKYYIERTQYAGTVLSFQKEY